MSTNSNDKEKNINPGNNNQAPLTNVKNIQNTSNNSHINKRNNNTNIEANNNKNSSNKGALIDPAFPIVALIPKATLLTGVGYNSIV